MNDNVAPFSVGCINKYATVFYHILFIVQPNQNPMQSDQQSLFEGLKTKM